MRDLEAEYIAAGAQVIWMLQETTGFQPATSAQTHEFYESSIASDVGLRVGDAETQPIAGAFENSPFIDTDRGFVMIVRKRDMKIVYENTHGNERTLNGQTLLDAVRAVEP